MALSAIPVGYKAADWRLKFRGGSHAIGLPTPVDHSEGRPATHPQHAKQGGVWKHKHCIAVG